jgi:sugar lactone lactonase YvrE
MPQFDCITIKENNDLGQPVWIESQQSLFWIDHTEQALFQYHQPTKEIISSPLGAPILSLSPRINNGFIATLEDGIGFYDLQQRQVTYISKPEPFARNKQALAGITDNYGNYWSFTKQSHGESNQGNFYQISPTMNMSRSTEETWDCTAPPAFSKDGSILYQSSGTSRYIYATQLNEQRQPINTETFCRVSKREGYPHGICVDNEDNLWVCHRAAGLLTRYNKMGECIDKIKVEAPGVKYCTFGGEGLDTLFIVTSGAEDLDRIRRKVKMSDAILSFKPGVTGLKLHQFAG